MGLGFLGIPTFVVIARRSGKRHAMMGVIISAIMDFVGTW